ncbi:MAG: DUF4838 domain-containing protein, partial [Planctomycetes bacterium]|nr:DUF4838 domain-containing protein [Planctomycetota bacterium]
MSRNSLWGFLLALSLFSAVLPACAAENGAVIVRKGKPVASGIYISAECEKNSSVRLAAKDLVTAIEKMSGANIAIVEIQDAGTVPNEPAVVLGNPAAELGAGLKTSSLWKDISRTVIGNGRILVAGESDLAVNGAVMNLLHEQGVRYFLPSNIPGDIGTVMPSKKTVAWPARDEESHPHIRGRRVWGHNVGAHDWAHAHASRKWVRRNMGVSPVKIPSSHAWGRLIPKKRRKPEYYAVKRYDGDGNPVRGGQFCVSHPDVPGEVARTIIERFRAEPQRLAQSISPNDGGGACVCLRCKALDPRGHLEPSSGKRALSDRYIYFFNKIADIVAQKYPNRYLAYLVYSDYSRAPVKYTKIHPMIVPVFAPIRYCRMHSMFNPLCEENIRLRHEIEKYARYAKHIGYYGYNYNLAETIVPFSKITTWSRNLPWLYNQGLFQATIETLGNWNTNGPHIYLATRYLWSGEDPKTIMEDYYEKLGGAAADPLRQYWETVDKAYRTADVHSGGFYGPEQVLTKPVLEKMEN